MGLGLTEKHKPVEPAEPVTPPKFHWFGQNGTTHFSSSMSEIETTAKIPSDPPKSEVQ